MSHDDPARVRIDAAPGTASASSVSSDSRPQKVASLQAPNHQHHDGWPGRCRQMSATDASINALPHTVGTIPVGATATACRSAPYRSDGHHSGGIRVRAATAFAARANHSSVALPRWFHDETVRRQDGTRRMPAAQARSTARQPRKRASSASRKQCHAESVTSGRWKSSSTALCVSAKTRRDQC